MHSPVYAAEDDSDEEPSETIVVHQPARTIPEPVRGSDRGTSFQPSKKGGKNKPEDSQQDQMKRAQCKDLLNQIAKM